MIARSKNAAQAGKAPGKLSELYEKFEAEYGPLDLSLVVDPLDLALFGCLVVNLPGQEAIKAFRVLKTQFVDWNEVRISSAKEVQEVLREAAEPLELALIIKDFLQLLFTEKHHIGLEFLQEKTISDFRSFFKKKTRFDEAVVTLLLERLKDYPAFPLEGGAHQCLASLGVIPSDSTAVQAMKDVYSQIERENLLRWFVYVSDHARAGCPSFKKPASGKGTPEKPKAPRASKK